MSTVIPILIFILILSIVIFIHELGHFIAARRAGIFVEELALGMGPKLLVFRGKKKSLDGEVTLYTLRAFPIGGFCRMRGQDDDVPEDPEALNNKSIAKRALVMAGGSLMNFALALVLFFILIMWQGVLLPEREIFVHEISENLPGERAGLRAGDIITHIEGAEITQQAEVAEIIRGAEGQVEMRVLRDDVPMTFNIVPEFHTDDDGGRYVIGFTHASRGLFRSASLLDGASGSVRMLGQQAGAPFMLLGRLISGGQLEEGEGVMGLIGIGGMIVGAYQTTIARSFTDMFMTMLALTAAINAALGVMNLLPIPAMDGARLVFLGIEAIRKKPVPPEKEAMVHMIGLVSLLLLAVFIAYQDIARLVSG